MRFVRARAIAHARRRPERRRSRAASRRTAACTCPSGCRRSSSTRSPAPTTLRDIAARAARAVLRGRCAAVGAARAMLDDAFNFPGAARRRGERARAAVGARAVSRPDGGVQGLRRALPRRHAGAHAARRLAPRSRSSSRRRATPAARWPPRSTAGPGSTSWCCIRAGLVSAAPGAAARVLGRQRAHACASTARSTTASASSRKRSRIRRSPATLQLSSANSINVGRLLPQMVYYAQRQPGAVAPRRPRANFIVPSGNLGNVARLPVGARDRAADRRRSCSRRTRTGP